MTEGSAALQRRVVVRFERARLQPCRSPLDLSSLARVAGGGSVLSGDWQLTSGTSLTLSFLAGEPRSPRSAVVALRGVKFSPRRICASTSSEASSAVPYRTFVFVITPSRPLRPLPTPSHSTGRQQNRGSPRVHTSCTRATAPSRSWRRSGTPSPPSLRTSDKTAPAAYATGNKPESPARWG